MKPRLLNVAFLLLGGLFFPHPEADASRSDGHFPPPETATLARDAVTFCPRHTETHTAGLWIGATVTFNHDEHGRLSGIVVNPGSGASRTFTLGYDAYSQLSSSTSGGFSATYTGPGAGTPPGSARTAAGRLAKLTRGGVETNWSYEGSGLLTDVTCANPGGNSYDFHFTYDQGRRIASRTGSTGTQWTGLHYDGHQQLQGFNTGRGAVALGYDARGNRRPVAGAVVQQQADGLDQVSSRTLSSRGFGVFGAMDKQAKGRVTTSRQPWWEPLGVDAGNGEFSAWWDVPVTVNDGGAVPVEARVQGLLPKAGAGGKPAVNEQGVFLVVPPAAEAPLHDAAGRLTADAFWYYDWDGASRLLCLTRKEGTFAIPGTLSETLAFSYDADHRRNSITHTRVDAQGHAHLRRSYVLWAGSLVVMEDRSFGVDDDITVLPRRWFQWGADVSGAYGGAGGIGGLVAIHEESGRTLLPIDDGLGNIGGTLDAATGQTVSRYYYDPFGVPLGESGEADVCPFRWQSKWYDPVSEQYYFLYRHYSPRLACWLSADPLGEAGGFNLYAYCGNDPVNRHDPLGLQGAATRYVPVPREPIIPAEILRMGNGIARDLGRTPQFRYVIRPDQIEPNTRDINRPYITYWGPGTQIQRGREVPGESYIYPGPGSRVVPPSRPAPPLPFRFPETEESMFRGFFGEPSPARTFQNPAPPSGSPSIRAVTRVRIPGDADFIGPIQRGWTLAPQGMGAHLIQRANIAGRPGMATFDQASTPRFFPYGTPENAGAAHERLHRATRDTGVGLRRGSNAALSDAELLQLYGRAYSAPALNGVRGDLRTPDGSTVIARDVAPADAFRALLQWCFGQ